MTKTLRYSVFCLLGILLLFPCRSGMAQTGGTYDLSWHTTDSGGGTWTGGTYSISGTIGQLDTGEVMNGSGYELRGGFWISSSSAVVLEIFVHALDDDIEITWTDSGSDLYNVYFGYSPDQEPFDPLPGGQGVLPPVYHWNALNDKYDYYYNVEVVVK
ncbi:hypothetical protein JXQ70_10830 [bacterium]|nr:hypothetical protein [bacterium]